MTGITGTSCKATSALLSSYVLYLRVSLCHAQFHLQCVIRKLSNGIQPLADRIMTLILQLIQAAGKTSTVLEDAFLVVGSLASGVYCSFYSIINCLMIMVQHLRPTLHRISQHFCHTYIPLSKPMKTLSSARSRSASSATSPVLWETKVPNMLVPS